MTRGPGRHARRSIIVRIGTWDLKRWEAVATIVGATVALLTLFLTVYETGRGNGSPGRDQAVPTSTASTTTRPDTTTTEPATTNRQTTTTISAAAVVDSIWASVEVNPARIGTFSDNGEALMVPRGAEIIGGPPGSGCTLFHPWVAKRGGVSAEDTYLRLVLQGRQSNAVLVSSLRARIVQRRAPLAGTPLVCPSAGGAEIRFVRLDLDKSPAAGVYAELTEDMSMVRRKPVAFTLKKNETEVFDVWASTTQCYCKWVIELDLVVNGRHAVKTVTNRGQPFQTTAWNGNRFYRWDYVSRWYLGVEPQPRNMPLRPLA
jgi:hypothetical protein